MTEPTDAEMMELAHEVEALGLESPEQALCEYTKRALAKFGTQPAAAGEPVAQVLASVPHLRSMVVQMIPGAEVPPAGSQLYTAPPPQAVREPLNPDQVTAAAKKLAECMDYPWEFMPEPGRKNMRKHVQDVIDAAHGIKGGQHG